MTRIQIIWRYAIGGMSLWLALGCQHASSPNTPLASSTAEPLISLDLTQLVQRSQSMEIEVRYDHSLHRPMKYEAVALTPLLEKVLQLHELDPEQAEIRFVCKDGYAPNSSLADILAAEGGYLAYRDLTQPLGKDWPDSLAAAYAPFYLVWKNVPEENHALPWPFGLVKIEVRANSETYLRFFPHTKPEHAEGYQLFAQNCQKCHALDGVGGEMGPDFHAPKNITEYWKRKDLIAFAQHPQSYRRNSDMPAIRHLKPKELAQIVDYLQHLAQQR